MRGRALHTGCAAAELRELVLVESGGLVLAGVPLVRGGGLVGHAEQRRVAEVSMEGAQPRLHLVGEDPAWVRHARGRGITSEWRAWQGAQREGGQGSARDRGLGGEWGQQG